MDCRWPSVYGRVTLRTEDGRACDGIVVNESFGGVGIVFSEDLQLERAREIEVAYHGTPAMAIVRHVTAFSRGGCMVGLHWKSSATQKRVAELTELNNRRELSLPDRLSRFIELLPGGVQLLWSLHASGRWTELAEAVNRLSQDANAARVGGTEECLEVLMQLMEDSPQPKQVQETLERLVNEIVERTTRVAESFSR